MRTGRIRIPARRRLRRGSAILGAIAIGAASLGIAVTPVAAQPSLDLPVPGTLEVPTAPMPEVDGVLVRFRDAPPVGSELSAMAAGDAFSALDDVADDPSDVEVLPSGSVRVEVEPGEVDAVVAELAARDDVEWAEPEVTLRPTAVPNDPEFGSQWHLPAINASTAWDRTLGSNTVRVAVIDSAIDVSHPDLAGKVVSNETVYSSWCPADGLSSHGTSVAGVLAAATGNGVNVAGVGWNTSIIGIETLCYGGASPTAVYLAILFAVARGADVINLSLGGPSYSNEVALAVDYALSNGVIIVASAGNEGDTAFMYPAAQDGVIAVAATDEANNVASFSTRGSWVEIAAPGTNIRTLCNRSVSGCAGSTTVDGTSFAAPIVSGAVALLMGCERNPGVDAIRARLQQSSTPIAGTGANFAWGMLNVQGLLDASSPGYATVTSNGALEAFGGACNYGDLRSIPLNLPIVEAAEPPNRFGYWMVASDGGVFAFGNAGFFGSTGNIRLNQPIVGMASSPSGNGYRMVASDGGIFAFGDAGFFGSTGNITLNQPIVGMASTPSGNGYWLVARDGGIFAFGDAGFYGSTGAIRLNQPIVGMASTPSGKGYWLVASDGGIFAFGDAGFHGSTGNITLNQPITAMSSTPTGAGYWMVARDGGMFAFGDASFHGAAPGRHVASTVALLIA